MSILAGAFLVWIGWGVFDWAIFSAVWSGENREACAVEGAGACWPFVYSRFAQWIYGFYPIDQRWRVNICFLVGAAALVPMLMPSMPHKKWNALFLLIAYPLITLILLTGGHFTMSAAAFLTRLSFWPWLRPSCRSSPSASRKASNPTASASGSRASAFSSGWRRL